MWYVKGMSTTQSNMDKSYLEKSAKSSEVVIFVSSVPREEVVGVERGTSVTTEVNQYI